MFKAFSLSSCARAVLATAVVAAGACAHAQSNTPVKVGLMLPSSGTFADLGKAVSNGFKLYVTEQGGKLGGRPVEYIALDDESDPSKANENANKLIKRDKVDVLVVLVDKNWRAVSELADRNVILVKGRVVFEGTTDRLRSQPALLAEHLGI